jgi:hypothetical protein
MYRVYEQLQNKFVDRLGVSVRFLHKWDQAVGNVYAVDSLNDSLLNLLLIRKGRVFLGAL